MPKNTQLIEDVYKTDLIADVIGSLKAASTQADRLAFGSYRQETADEMKKHLEIAKRKIDNLLKRFES